jgi:hypothetical protein
MLWCQSKDDNNRSSSSDKKMKGRQGCGNLMSLKAVMRVVKPKMKVLGCPDVGSIGGPKRLSGPRQLQMEDIP